MNPGDAVRAAAQAVREQQAEADYRAKLEERRLQRELEQAETKHAVVENKPLPTAELVLVVETFDGKPTHVRISAFGRAVGYSLTNPEQTIGEAVDLAWPLLLARACGL